MFATCNCKTRPSAYHGEERLDTEEEAAAAAPSPAPYEFSLDPETKAAEKKLRRVVAKQVKCRPNVVRTFIGTMSSIIV